MANKRKWINRPTFKTKRQALQHGHITHGQTKEGVRKFRLWKTKHGWSVTSKKNIK